MAWRNRITGIKNRTHSFRKLDRLDDNDGDDDMPLLVQSTSSLVSSSPSARSGSGGDSCVGLSFKAKSIKNTNSNIAAVPDEIEALSFPEFNNECQNEKGSFIAQFKPNNVMTVEENRDTATIFDDDDDDASNDGSMFTAGSKEECNDEEVKDSLVTSLRAPSMTGSDMKNKDNNSRNFGANSVSKLSITHSTTNSKSTGEDKMSRNSRRSRNRSIIDEDVDAATWNADKVDAFVDVDDFGNSTESGKVPMMMQSPAIEISGVSLLTERDNSVNELLEVSHLMTFNTLVLIQKQKDWIEGSGDATNGANKGISSLITMELENLERKIKLMMDHKIWPNEKERMKQERDPLTPSKAFFKAMALIDKSIEQFHSGYLKFMANTSEENHELKTRVAELVALNASLQDEASRSRQKTETIRNLQRERDDLTQKVDRTDERLTLLIKSKVFVDENENTSPNKDSKFHNVKSYIHKLESEREKHLTEIQSLKSAIKNTDSVKDEESTSSVIDDADERGSLDGSSTISNDSNDKHSDACVLDDDLGSQWHALQENEEATALAASKEQQVSKLSAKVAERDSALNSLRSECKLMRMQLLQLETNRNEYKSQCESKNSALTASQDRIANLEDEVLRTHARCATYEEDYEALKESFATHKEATKQQLTNSQLDVKAQIESIQTESEEKLQRSGEQLKEVKEDRERLVRDLKVSVKEIESERDSLRTILAENAEAVTPITEDSYSEEKKESECVASISEAQRLIESEKDLKNFEQMRGRLAEKASEQVFTIATLQEENDIKDEQLKSLNEMVEMLLGKNCKEDDKNRPWGQRISKLRDLSQRGASGLLNRSRHGSMHGSRHGSMHGSQHGMIED